MPSPLDSQCATAIESEDWIRVVRRCVARLGSSAQLGTLAPQAGPRRAQLPSHVLDHDITAQHAHLGPPAAVGDGGGAAAPSARGPDAEPMPDIRRLTLLRQASYDVLDEAELRREQQRTMMDLCRRLNVSVAEATAMLRAYSWSLVDVAQVRRGLRWGGVGATPSVA